jgi:rare lipoprotein A
MVVRAINGFPLSVFMTVFIAFMTVFIAPSLAADTARHSRTPHDLSGIASVYRHEGGRTASGEATRPGGFTAAHRTLPLNTLVRVKNRKTGREVTVRINDRGPFVKGRVIDLTPKAAAQIGLRGLAPVDLTVLD